MAKRYVRVKTPAAPMSVAIAWYDAAQWLKLKLFAEDAANLDDTHEAWQRNAMSVDRDFRKKDIEIQRVSIDIDALVIWCTAHKKPINGKARSEYSAELASKS